MMLRRSQINRIVVDSVDCLFVYWSFTVHPQLRSFRANKFVSAFTGEGRPLYIHKVYT